MLSLVEDDYSAADLAPIELANTKTCSAFPLVEYIGIGHVSYAERRSSEMLAARF